MFAAKGKKGGGKSALSSAIANQIQKKPKTVKPAKPRAAAPAFVAGTGGGTIAQFLRAKSQSKVQQKLSLLNRFSTAQKTKQDAETKANQAENATVAPPGEGAAMSNAGQVETVEAVAAPDPKEAAAKAKMTETLQKNVPTSLKQVDEFKEKGKGKEIGDSVKGVVSADTEGVKSTYQEVENAPPPEPAAAPDVMPEPEAAPAAANPNMGEGVVGETSSEQQDMTEFSKGTDDAVKKEGIEEENLKMVDDGDLGTANKERADLKKQVTDAPNAIKKTEQTEKKAVQQDVQKEETNAKNQIKNKRQNNLKKAQADQKKGKSTLEKKREAVTAQINGIYEQTNRTVKKTLEELEKQALRTFDQGQKKATETFEANVKRRMDKFKKDRYDVFGGSLLWLKDKLLGMDDMPEVKQIFDEERAIFVATIDTLIKNITAENKRVIAFCKGLIANAKKRIAAFVATLGPSLRSAGLAAQKDIQGKLNALDNEVNDAQKKLEEALAKKREAAIKAIDEKIAKMKEAMKGALGKLAGLIFEALMKFFKWALKKAGMDPDALINKVTSTIKAIVKNPKGFFGNLIKAVKGGVFNFRDNIKTHLIKGLIDWITGGLQGAGITLPTTWDLKGIIGLVLQILGLTWANIRRHLVDKMGEKTIAFVEKAIEMGEKALEIFKKIKAGGFGALWDMIKDKAEEIKGMVMEKIRDFISTEVIKAGIVKLVSMLNPVGAIAQAIMGIYNAVMFFVENGSRIAAFVSSIFDSIANIAAGSLGAASAAVEGALAKTIPIIINFIARLAGLGNLGAKVAKVIQAIQKPVNMVLEKLAGIVAKIVKPLLAAGANLLKKGAQAGVPKDPQKRLDEGMKVAMNAVNRFAGKKVGKLALNPILSGIKLRYGFQSLEAKNKNNKWAIVGTVNPTSEQYSNAVVEAQGDKPLTTAEENLVKTLPGGLEWFTTYSRILKDGSDKIAATVAEARTVIDAVNNQKKKIVHFGKEIFVAVGSEEKLKTELDVLTDDEMIEVKSGDYTDAKKLSGRDFDQFLKLQYFYTGKKKFVYKDNGKFISITPPKKWIYQFTKKSIDVRLKDWLLKQGVTEVRTGK